MLIGVPKEIKNHEYRVGLTPAGVRELVAAGHEVLIENDAGRAIGLDNTQYLQAHKVFKQAHMIIKVKEPQTSECKMLSPGQILFTYLHLAADQTQTDLLLKSGASCIAYETVTDDHGGLPLLAPMSEVAGRLAPQDGTCDGNWWWSRGVKCRTHCAGHGCKRDYFRSLFSAPKRN